MPARGVHGSGGTLTTGSASGEGTSGSTGLWAAGRVSWSIRLGTPGCVGGPGVFGSARVRVAGCVGGPGIVGSTGLRAARCVRGAAGTTGRVAGARPMRARRVAGARASRRDAGSAGAHPTGGVSGRTRSRRLLSGKAVPAIHRLSPARLLAHGTAGRLLTGAAGRLLAGAAAGRLLPGAAGGLLAGTAGRLLTGTAGCLLTRATGCLLTGSASGRVLLGRATGRAPGPTLALGRTRIPGVTGSTPTLGGRPTGRVGELLSPGRVPGTSGRGSGPDDHRLGVPLRRGLPVRFGDRPRGRLGCAATGRGLVGARRFGAASLGRAGVGRLGCRIVLVGRVGHLVPLAQA